MDSDASDSYTSSSDGDDDGDGDDRQVAQSAAFALARAAAAAKANEFGGVPDEPTERTWLEVKEKKERARRKGGTHARTHPLTLSLPWCAPVLG